MTTTLDRPTDALWRDAQRKADAGLVPLPVALPHHPEIGPVAITADAPPAPEPPPPAAPPARTCTVCGTAIGAASKSGLCRQHAHAAQAAAQQGRPRAEWQPASESLDSLIGRWEAARREVAALEQAIRARIPPEFLEVPHV